MLKIITGSLVSAALLGGCAASVEPMRAGDGRDGYAISCDGSAYSWAKCYRAAAKACPTGYDVLDRDTNTTATAYGPNVSRSLVVACKRA